MKKLNSYIQEKLVINKDSKVNNFNFDELTKTFDTIEDLYDNLISYFGHNLRYKIKPADADVMKVVNPQDYKKPSTIVVDKDFLISLNIKNYDSLIGGLYNNKIIFLLYHTDQGKMVNTFLMQAEDGYELKSNQTFADWLNTSKIKNIDILKKFFINNKNE